ncbi:MAG: T9SS type A sorting domain-containing protein [Flavobacteriales bacterium]|nr:T9SS type A sorting domain-containing protein [Flavobacteriales bacterium]
MKHYCTLLAAVFLSCQWSYAQPPRVDWGFPIDSDQFDYGGHVQSDAEGNIYVAGEFSGAVDMDSWEDEQWMLDPGPGGMSSFVAKYAGSGELVWAMALESNTSGEVANTIQDLVVSSDGTIHIVMEVNSGLDLNPLGSEVPIQAMTPTAQGFFHDIVLVQYATDGSYSWHKQIIGSSSADRMGAAGLDLTANGSIILTGAYFGDIDLDQSNSSTSDSLHSVVPSGNQAFIATYGANGEFVAAIDFDQESDVKASAVPNSDFLGFVVFLSTSEASFDFDPGSEEWSFPTNPGVDNVVAFDSDMEFIFGTPAATVQGGESGYSVFEALPLSNGQVIVRSSVYGTVQIGDSAFVLGSGSPSQALSVLSFTGEPFWARLISESSALGRLLGRLVNDDVVLGFAFNSPVDLDGAGGNPEAILIPESSTDFGFVRYSTEGTFVEAFQIVTGSELTTYGLDVTDGDNLVITGEMFGTIDFDPTEFDYSVNIPFTPDEYDGAFLVKYLNFTTGITERRRLGSIRLSPNPSSSSVRIGPVPDGSPIEAVTVFDPSGRSISLASTRSGSEVTLDLEGIASGLYVIHVLAGDQRYVSTLGKK